MKRLVDFFRLREPGTDLYWCLDTRTWPRSMTPIVLRPGAVDALVLTLRDGQLLHCDSNPVQPEPRTLG